MNGACDTFLFFAGLIIGLCLGMILKVVLDNFKKKKENS